MIITFLTLLISAFFIFFPPYTLTFDPEHLSWIVWAGGITLFFATILLYVFVLTPLVYFEQNLIPGVVDIVRRDFRLRCARYFLFGFILLSFVCASLVKSFPVEGARYHEWWFFGWFILFGFSIDLLQDSWHRFARFLDPSFCVAHLATEGIHAIQNNKKESLLHDLDAMSEIVFRAVEKGKLALATQALRTFPLTMKTFFESAKSIGHPFLDVKEGEDVRTGDESSFILFYLLERFELINDKALRERQEAICRQMLIALGKIIVHSGRFDLSLVSFPTHFLTKFGLKDLQHHFDEAAVLATSTLLTIAKAITTEMEITYAELLDPFKSIINGLAAIIRATCKKEKNASVKALAQPLLDLRALLETEKMSHHRDTPTIIKEVEKVLEEFSVLEQVLNTIPSFEG